MPSCQSIANLPRPVLTGLFRHALQLLARLPFGVHGLIRPAEPALIAGRLAYAGHVPGRDTEVARLVDDDVFRRRSAMFPLRDEPLD